MTKAAAKTVLDPKKFDFAAVIARVKRPAPKTVAIFLAADLYGRIEELDEQIGTFDRKISNAEETAQEVRGVDDPDPIAELNAEREPLLAEYNELADEFNASEMQFTFRVLERGDRTAARAAMIADGHQPDDDEDNEIAPCYMMAQTCETVPWSGGQWLEFRDAVGEPTFMPLMNGMSLGAIAGAGVTAPFLRKPSPTRGNEKPLAV